jgi:hypothetical protein
LALTQIAVVNQIGDWRWRLCNLYKVRNEQNEVVRFIPKTEQIDLLSSMCGWDIILKARQLGFTTLIDIFALDQAFFADIAAAIIAHGASEVEKIFRNKVRFPYEQLPEQLRADNPTNNDSANELVFVKGGSIYVANSARSGTLQFLHVSEMGKIARRFPERSREIVTGSFPTIHEGGMVFVESTAEGTGGDFYDLVKGAEKTDASIKASKRPRQRMEFKLHFYPWWKEPKYRLNPEGVAINAEMAKYFLSLEKVYGITLDAEQAAWYVVKARLLKRRHEARVPVDGRRGLRGRQRGALLRQPDAEGPQAGPHQGAAVPAGQGREPLPRHRARHHLRRGRTSTSTPSIASSTTTSTRGRPSTRSPRKRRSAAGSSGRYTCRTTAPTRAW